jgi:predicted enzyme related to lactoylglutathione lyase
MAATFRHFAINADDPARARRFYEAAFGWTFEPWGPPDFFQITNAGDGVLGALQDRRDLLPDARLRSFEPTFGVEDLKATLEAVKTGGGRLLMAPMRLEGVGELAYFEDTEGNVVGVMQYEPGAFA